ncbi:MAG: FtsX-like permease family protein [Gammaproteobacteria bacterium]|nr:FtsX-like permease family protein [Gammaproteobacteria bacterium]
MSVALYVASRYLTGGRNHYARFVTWVSLVGLALGVLVLTVVVSVMNGFDAELRLRILGTVPHVVLTSRTESSELLDAVIEDVDVTSAYRFFSAAGMVSKNAAVNPVTIFGLDGAGARELAQVADNMVVSTLSQALAEPGGIVMGVQLATHIGLLLGDDVMLVVSESVNGSVRAKLKRFRLTGAFEIGADFDYTLVLVARDAFSETERARMGTDGIRVQLIDPMQAGAFADRWRGIASDVVTWTDSYGALFQAVRVEKVLMFLILLLVVAVAGFNIVSGQTMVVHDKQADIAILRTLGATASEVQRIFLLQGIVIASLGIVVGLALGVLVAANIATLVATVEAWFGFRLLEGSYFVAVPSRVLLEDLWVIGGLSWLLCLLAAWIPARRATEQNPVEGLH